MEPFPNLFTPRLRLRKIEIEDVPALLRYANNPKIAQFVLNIPHPYQEPDAVFRISYVVQGFKNKARVVWAIVSKERDELIGEIGLHFVGSKDVAQLGYWIGEPFWNTGIGSETVAAVARFGFENLGLNLIFGTCHVENPASAKVLSKNGFAEVSINGNVCQMNLTKDEFERRAAQSA